MKNQFLLTCFFCLMLQAFGFSQSDFASVGTKWTYTEWVLSPNPAIGTLYPFYTQVDSEVLFQGRLCRRLLGGRAGQPQLPRFYLYNQNDSVFWWDFYNQRFNLLYDFSAQTGDSWEIEMPHGSLPEGDTTNTVHVDSMSHIILDGDTLKVWHISYDEWADWSDIIIENIGSTCYMIPVPDLHEFNICDLRCFENDTVELLFVDYPCDTLITIGSSSILENTGNRTIQLYPNPALDHLQIECSEYRGELLKIELFDISGKIMRSEQFYNTGNYTFSFPELPAGWYLLDLIGKGTRLKTVKIAVIK